jgi:hypothetical protein
VDCGWDCSKELFTEPPGQASSRPDQSSASKLGSRLESEGFVRCKTCEQVYDMGDASRREEAQGFKALSCHVNVGRGRWSNQLDTGSDVTEGRSCTVGRISAERSTKAACEERAVGEGEGEARA